MKDIDKAASPATPAQSGEPCKNNNPATQKIIERWIKDERLAQSAEPVYQIEQSNGSWLDVSKVAYQSTEDYRRRIVYAAPQSAHTAQSGEPCLGCNSNWPLHDLDCPVAVEGLAAKVAPSAVALDDEREAFEHWITTEGDYDPIDMVTHQDGEVYVLAAVHEAWEAWQGRWKHVPASGENHE